MHGQIPQYLMKFRTKCLFSTCATCATCHPVVGWNIVKMLAWKKNQFWQAKCLDWFHTNQEMQSQCNGTFHLNKLVPMSDIEPKHSVVRILTYMAAENICLVDDWLPCPWHLQTQQTPLDTQGRRSWPCRTLNSRIGSLAQNYTQGRK